MADAPSLAIVVVTYNVRGELHACLRSLAAQTLPGPTSVTVVDNASTDGTSEMIRRDWPAVQLIEPRRNLGFSAGNNVGIRATRSDLVLLLNPDTVVPAGAIAALVAVLERHPRVAAVGPRLVGGDGLPELSFGSSTGPLGELRQKVVGALYDRRLGWMVRHVDACTRQPGPRAWLTAACLLVWRRDLDAVGLFDERYTMYMEDVDLCVALRQRGRQVRFAPDVEVLHLRGRSAGRNPQTEVLRRTSQLAYYAKHHPRWVRPLKWYVGLSQRASTDYTADPDADRD